MMKKWYVIVFVLLVSLISSCKQTREVTKDSVVKEKHLTEEQNFDFQYSFIDGNKQMMLGNYEMAKNLFYKCLKINENDPAIHYKIATINVYEKNYDEALIHSKTAYEINPENEWYGILLASLYEQLGDIDSAIAIYKELKKLHPENPQYFFEIAIVLQNNKRYEEAIKMYNEIESAFGISETISMEKEKLHIALGQRDKAKQEIEKLVAFFPDDTRYIGILADYAMQENNLEEAKKLYDKILLIEPDNGLVRISLATYYFTQGNYYESIENMKKAFSSNKIESSIKTNILLSILEGKNKVKPKENDIEELVDILLEKHPDDYNAHLIYSDILLQKGDYEEARNELSFISEKIKDKYLIWEQLILVQNQLFDYEGMYNSSNEAIEYFPNQSVLYLFSGIAAIQVKKYAEAIEKLSFGEKLVTSDDPQKLQFYTYLGEAYYNSKQSKIAFEYFDKILEKEPDNMLILNNYSYYLSEIEQNLTKAKEMSYKTIEKEPNNPTYLDTYAWILYKMKDYENAKIYIEKALKNGGLTNATLMDHYGDILAALGLTAEANEAWNRAYELGNDNDILKKITQ